MAIGTNTAGIHIIQELSGMADKIIIANHRNIFGVKLEVRDRVMDWNVGPDQWSNPYHPELIKIVNQFLDRMDIRTKLP